MAHAGVPLILFLLLLRFLVPSAYCSVSGFVFCRQVFLRAAHGSSSPCGCPECFVSFKIFHTSKMTYSFQKNIIHTDIQFSMCREEESKSSLHLTLKIRGADESFFTNIMKIFLKYNSFTMLSFITNPSPTSCSLNPKKRMFQFLRNC